jgi:hypothetical protein
MPKRSFIALTSACTRLKWVPYPGWMSSLMPLTSSFISSVFSFTANRIRIVIELRSSLLIAFDQGYYCLLSIFIVIIDLKASEGQARMANSVRQGL